MSDAEFLRLGVDDEDQPSKSDEWDDADDDASSVASLSDDDSSSAASSAASAGANKRDKNNSDDDACIEEHLVLKPDHAAFPLWMLSNNEIFLERHSPAYRMCYEFLAAVADPLERTEIIQRWKLTKLSMHTASSINLEPDDIVQSLNGFSKNELPASVVAFIKAHASSYGKCKLVLRQSRLFVESTRRDLVDTLLNDTVIADAATAVPQFPPDVYGFEVAADRVEQVKRRAIELDLPLMEEYDYTSAQTLDVNLRTLTAIRPYQVTCLKKMFGNRRARSGIFVLPCGAGKTLTGIAAVSTMKVSALVVCTSSVSVEQWKRQFAHFATVPASHLCRYTSRHKDPLPGKDDCVLVTTYAMLAAMARRGAGGESITAREWGLLILDEVHVAPAKLFRRIVTTVKSHCKLGLTATMVREDALIHDLGFLVGPKLYEANWMDLTQQGFLANVKCEEVLCAMTAEFMAEYLKGGRGHHLANLLVTCNPNKFRTCEFLMHAHEQRGDKVIVFVDNIAAIELYASLLHRPCIQGTTSEKQRLNLFAQFQNSRTTNTLVISKVGDVAIDLPECSVIIQVSSHFGSRRQEAQRMGRVLRPKPASRSTGGGAGDQEGYNAHFYSLVVPDTKEMFFAARRQSFLQSQGYCYHKVDDMDARMRAAGFYGVALRTRAEQLALLTKLVLAHDLNVDAKRAKMDEPTRVAPSRAVVAPHTAAAPTVVHVEEHALPAPTRVRRGKLAEFS